MTTPVRRTPAVPDLPATEQAGASLEGAPEPADMLDVRPTPVSPTVPSLQLQAPILRRPQTASLGFTQRLTDPRSDAVSNSQAQFNLTLLYADAINALAAHYPEVDRALWLRVPEWIATYLAITELRIYGHELGHARVAEHYGHDTQISMRFHHAVTFHQGPRLTADQNAEVSAAGLNQGEQDAVYHWRQAQSGGADAWAAQLSYVLHHLNASFYALGSMASHAAGQPKSGDDVAAWLGHVNDGRNLEHGRFLALTLATALLSPDTWRGALAQWDFVAHRRRESRPWTLELGALQATMPHFRTLLTADDQLVGARIGFRLADHRPWLEVAGDVGTLTHQARGELRLNDLQLFRLIDFSPYLSVGKGADGTPSYVAGAEVSVHPLALTSITDGQAQLRLGVALETSHNDAVHQSIEHTPEGFRAILTAGGPLPW